jgi:hypothetical protein
MWESVCKPLVSVILQSAYPNMSGLTRRVGLSEGDCITKKNQEDSFTGYGSTRMETCRNTAITDGALLATAHQYAHAVINHHTS